MGKEFTDGMILNVGRQTLLRTRVAEGQVELDQFSSESGGTFGKSELHLVNVPFVPKTITLQDKA